MGKKIDRFVLTVALAFILFAYFESAFKNRIFSIFLSVIVCAIIRKGIGKIAKRINATHWRQKQIFKRRSSAVLLRLACMEETDAKELLDALLKKSYRNEAPISIELTHPSVHISQERIFRLWRENRGSNQLVICTTGKCTNEARAFAATLQSPRIAIVDADVLIQLICEHPDGFYPAPTATKRHMLRINQLSQILFNRRNSPRCVLFSVSMLIMYIFSGNLYYLSASLALLFIVFVSLHQVKRPRKLF